MPLLLYCVADASASLNLQIGVAGSPITRREHSSLAVFYSESPGSELWLRAPLRTSAREFHRVHADLFQSAAIIPFRFPTILESEAELRDHMIEHADEYKSLLQRLAYFVQMDITLSHASVPKPSSGSEFLRQRQSRAQALEHFAETMRNATSHLAKDWRQRSSSNGFRCFALLERKQIEEFNETIKCLSAPREINARVSGPWPVAEFLELSKDA